MSGRSDDAKEARDMVYTGKEPFEKFDRQERQPASCILQIGFITTTPSCNAVVILASGTPYYSSIM